MAECKDIAEEASNLLDGNLPFRKRIALRLHLLYCSCCRAYIQQLKQTISTITVLRPQEKDTTDTSALAKKLQELSKNQ
jgi:predicted anti-sigma-YlaC factor YlaD